MYEKILVPLDASHRAEAILPHVRAMARAYQSSVTLLMVIEPIPTMVGAHDAALIAMEMQDIEKLKNDALDYLRPLAESMKQEGIDAHCMVMHGPVVECILSAADREKAGLIAMASHGRSGLGHVFYGSVASGVLNRADRPLLLVRSRDEE
ncbi:MAG: universal stress protein [Anaerolineae bacterium]|nr:universal stress protein [Anaerolineae bacterium]